jgi:hypothetical protein
MAEICLSNKRDKRLVSVLHTGYKQSDRKHKILKKNNLDMHKRKLNYQAHIRKNIQAFYLSKQWKLKQQWSTTLHLLNTKNSIKQYITVTMYFKKWNINSYVIAASGQKHQTE